MPCTQCEYRYRAPFRSGATFSVLFFGVLRRISIAGDNYMLQFSMFCFYSHGPTISSTCNAQNHGNRPFAHKRFDRLFSISDENNLVLFMGKDGQWTGHYDGMCKMETSTYARYATHRSLMLRHQMSNARQKTKNPILMCEMNMWRLINEIFRTFDEFLFGD